MRMREVTQMMFFESLYETTMKAKMTETEKKENIQQGRIRATKTNKAGFVRPGLASENSKEIGFQQARNIRLDEMIETDGIRSIGADFIFVFCEGELSFAFWKHYKFNSALSTTHEDLQRMEKKASETFKEYAQRWRIKTAQVQPPMTESELNNLFVKSMRGPYLDKMLTHSSDDFAKLVHIGENIEDAIKSGKIPDANLWQALMENNQGNGRKFNQFNQFKKDKKEGEQYSPQPHLYQAYPPSPKYATYPANPPKPYPNRPNTFDRRFRKIDRIPLSYLDVYNQLTAVGIVTPIPPPKVQDPLPKGFNPEVQCIYHSGGVGHDIEICWSFKHLIQNLLEEKKIAFETASDKASPSITNNPLPKHANPGGS
ncbi:hypothetical protein SLEP1_g49169 [Rubroshorea leprosula]|uniref:Uncharacterized protein n=1 Tax=Rubroshorea leprosula TaxID=152421 RepID=A0AAV5LX82_9ROSI|nr:hypothetical protein SLEP1_g49169 [Rubroshorea leprosula]